MHLLLKSVATSFLKVPFGCAMLVARFQGYHLYLKSLINSWKSASPFEQVKKLGCDYSFDQAVLELKDLLATTSSVLGLKACINIAGLFFFFNSLTAKSTQEEKSLFLNSCP